jgi:hypothetical protein
MSGATPPVLQCASKARMEQYYALHVMELLWRICSVIVFGFTISVVKCRSFLIFTKKARGQDKLINIFLSFLETARFLKKLPIFKCIFQFTLYSLFKTFLPGKSLARSFEKSAGLPVGFHVKCWMFVYKFIQCWNWEEGRGKTPYHKIWYRFLLEMVHVDLQFESGT